VIFRPAIFARALLSAFCVVAGFCFLAAPPRWRSLLSDALAQFGFPGRSARLCVPRHFSVFFRAPGLSLCAAGVVPPFPACWPQSGPGLPLASFAGPALRWRAALSSAVRPPALRAVVRPPRPGFRARALSTSLPWPGTLAVADVRFARLRSRSVAGPSVAQSWFLLANTNKKLLNRGPPFVCPYYQLLPISHTNKYPNILLDKV